MNVPHILKIYNAEHLTDNSNLKHTPKNKGKKRRQQEVVIKRDEIIKALKKHKDLCKNHLAKLSGVSKHTTGVTVDILKAEGVVSVTSHRVNGCETYVVNLKAKGNKDVNSKH